jgi:exodeoxyribonuclease VII small subunit
MAGFEEHLTQLETVVQKLERGDLTLDESLRLFEDGMKLSQACKAELEQAEGRIQVLMEGKNGAMRAVGMETEEDSEEAGLGEVEDQQ